MESSITTPDYDKLVLTVTTNDYVEMLNAIVQARLFNENLKKSCEDSPKPNEITREIIENCEKRLKALDTLLNNIKEKYLEYYASIYWSKLFKDFYIKLKQKGIKKWDILMQIITIVQTTTTMQ